MIDSEAAAAMKRDRNMCHVLLAGLRVVFGKVLSGGSVHVTYAYAAKAEPLCAPHFAPRVVLHVISAAW